MHLEGVVAKEEAWVPLGLQGPWCAESPQCYEGRLVSFQAALVPNQLRWL